MELQHSKCGYCEKWLEGSDYGTIEHDMEHYRPKSSVKAYPKNMISPLEMRGGWVIFGWLTIR